ncbi:MAG: HAD hydrolase family protein [Planctomycetota bacterium]
MQLRVFALDYDGTIAHDDRLDPEVRSAIEQVRRHTSVVLVTGRILDDLRCHVGDLSLFDAVVAENGAVVAFPAAGRSNQIAPPPPPAFVSELRRRGLDVRQGRCVVELRAADAGAVLEVVRALELPLTLHFNRDRLMVLPQAVSKATGLREALRTLRLSTHNTIAIGDAENDHELLAACEFGVAVEWGSAALRRAADHVVSGRGPPAVAAFLREHGDNGRIPAPPIVRRSLVLGRDEAGEVVTLAVRGRNVLITGDPRSGKSWVGGLLCEQLIVQQYCTCVIDPEGDYTELESLPGVLVLGNDRAPTMHELTRAIRYSDVSVIVDLSGIGGQDKHDHVIGTLRLLMELRRQTGLPHRIVVDEAHYFLHEQADVEVLDEGVDGMTLITYRVGGLQPEMLRRVECAIVTRGTDPEEVRRLHAAFHREDDLAAWIKTLGGLAIDEAVLLPVTAEAQGRLRRFHIAPRLTRHVRHRHKYLDVATPGNRAFRFELDGTQGPVVGSMRELVHALGCIPVARLVQHVQRGDLSRWIAEVIADKELAAAVRDVEEQHRLGQLPDFNGAVIRAIRDRYAVTDWV